MKAILFGKLNGLTSIEVRMSLVRIPEVLHRLKLAQKILDDMNISGVDLLSSMTSSTDTSKDLNNLLTSIVHIALYERYLKNNPSPDFFVSMAYSESPIPFCLGRSSFESIVIESKLLKSHTLVQFPNRLTSKDILELDPYIFNSFHFEKYSVIHLNGYGNRKIVFESQSSEKVIEKLINKYGVQKFVNIGPFDILLDPQNSKFHGFDVQIENSIESDPMLGWFRNSIEFLRSEIMLVS